MMRSPGVAPTASRTIRRRRTASPIRYSASTIAAMPSSNSTWDIVHPSLSGPLAADDRRPTQPRPSPLLAGLLGEALHCIELELHAVVGAHPPREGAEDLVGF